MFPNDILTASGMVTSLHRYAPGSIYNMLIRILICLLTIIILLGKQNIFKLKKIKIGGSYF